MDVSKRIIINFNDRMTACMESGGGHLLDIIFNYYSVVRKVRAILKKISKPEIVDSIFLNISVQFLSLICLIRSNTFFNLGNNPN